MEISFTTYNVSGSDGKLKAYTCHFLYLHFWTYSEYLYINASYCTYTTGITLNLQTNAPYGTWTIIITLFGTSMLLTVLKLSEFTLNIQTSMLLTVLISRHQCYLPYLHYQNYSKYLDSNAPYHTYTIRIILNIWTSMLLTVLTLSVLP